MGKKRVVRKAVRSSEEVKRDKVLRAKFQRLRPSLEDLVESGEYSAALPQGELLSLMEFAAAIKATRKAMGLSLAAVAESSGIDKAAISKLESGYIENPTYSTLERIANALGKHVKLALDDARENNSAARAQ